MTVSQEPQLQARHLQLLIHHIWTGGYRFVALRFPLKVQQRNIIRNFVAGEEAIQQGYSRMHRLPALCAAVCRLSVVILFSVSMIALLSKEYSTNSRPFDCITPHDEIILLSIWRPLLHFWLIWAGHLLLRWRTIDVQCERIPPSQPPYEPVRLTPDNLD
jgi:hypothetical protein